MRFFLLSQQVFAYLFFNIHTDVVLFLYLNTCMGNIAIFEPFYYTLLALNQQVLFYIEKLA